MIKVAILVLLDYVLQFINCDSQHNIIRRRNPCFIRLCFAIKVPGKEHRHKRDVAILVLLDYVLQSEEVVELE